MACGEAVRCRRNDDLMLSIQGHRRNSVRRQQYRRLSRAAAATMASAAAMMLALAVASAGAVSAAGVLLVLALGFGLYARHWLSLARRSGVGARSEDEVRYALAPLQAEGWRLRHSLPWQAEGTSTRWRSRRPASGLWSRRRRGRMTIAIWLGCATRRRGCRASVGGGVGAARCRLCVWFARAASSGLSGRCWCSRLIG